MDLDPPSPGEVAGLTGLGRKVSVGPARRRAWVGRFLGICLLAALVSSPARLAGGVYQETSQTTQVQRAWVTAAFAGKKPQTIAFEQPQAAPAAAQVTLLAPASSGLVVSFASDTPLVCTVSGFIVTTVAAGACVITASQSGSARYAPAPDVARSFLVRAGQKRQVIRFAPPGGVAVGVLVTLSASAAPRLEVSFASDTPLVCTVSGSTVTTVTPGACVITASQGGSAIFAPAPDVARSFPVHAGRKSQTIAFTQPPDAAAGVPVTLSASATSGLVVSFTSDTPPVCTVSGRTVMAAAPGTCTITASQGGSARYAPASGVTLSFSVKAGQKGQEIFFAPPPGTAVGVPVTLSASATSGLPVSFSSGTPLVCTVSGRTVTTVAPGTCTVTASQGGSATFAPAPGVTRRFEAHAGKQPQAIAFSQPPAAKVGVPVTLSASATSGLAVTFASDTPLVCTVSGSTVTTVAPGACTVTASQGGSARFAAAPGVTRRFEAHAGKQPQTIAFSQPPAAPVGAPVTLSASATSGLPVTFSSGTPPVCTVSGSAVTTAAAGTCTVTASQGGSARYAPASGVTRSFEVRPGSATQTIAFSQPPAAKVGAPVTLSASATSGLAVSFSSGTPPVCTVSGSAVTTVAPGRCTVTASQGGSARYAPAPGVQQSFQVNPVASKAAGALLISLAAAVLAAAGGALVIRRLRRRSRPPSAPEPIVRVMPDAGPPDLVSVRDTGTAVTHTVRIEPSPGISITTIEEARP
jgi:hypothetical protein